MFVEVVLPLAIIGVCVLVCIGLSIVLRGQRRRAADVSAPARVEAAS